MWKTDGTAAGKVMVKDINPGELSSSPANLTNVGGILYFSAAGTGDNNIGYNTELWKSDGTDAGTVMVKDIYVGAITSQPSFFTNVNGSLFFTANTSAAGTELWKSDGTDAGTIMVKDIYSGSIGSSPKYLTNVNGTVFFSAAGGVTTANVELWKRDGTDAGTVLVKEINAGFTTSAPNYLVNMNGTLYFTATNGAAVNGTELWKSDGTAEGTIGFDMQPGPNGSFPAAFGVLNNSLIFSGTDPLYSTELWSIGSTPIVANFTWTGNVNNVWEEPGNWDGNSVPTATSAVIIPAGRSKYPIVNTSTTVKSIQCATGTSVTVAGGVVFNILR